jgi:Protein of unknown function (DUF2924)
MTSPLIADIGACPREDLVAHWDQLFDRPLPRRTSTPFLRRLIAYELQARAKGGLSSATTRKLDGLAESKARTSSPRLAAGGTLIREWNGVRHVVEVKNDGFYWRGTRHRSLSAIAKAITGAHWSGPRFFGLADGRS